MEFLQKIKVYIESRNRLCLWVLIALFCVIISALVINKYYSFGFNALDLGIYNQVFYNSVHGHLFQFSIHPHSYLGDHFELFIIFLLPFYAISQSPVTLLVLQTIAVGLAMWPLYSITREKLSPLASLGLCLIFALNPFTLNILFFEFHLLPFAIPLLLFAFYFYRKNKFAPYLIFLSLSLLVREDVAWVVAMMGILAAVNRKKMKWILAPIIMGGAWFFISTQLIGWFNQYGSYKFLYMYAWLGNSPKEIIINILAHPGAVIKQIVSVNNILLILGLSLPLAGLPLLRPRYLIPTLLIFAQFFLTTVSTTVILETHYTSLFIPFFFIATVFALEHFQKNQVTPGRWQRFVQQQKALLLAILTVVVMYSFVTFSPVIPAVRALFPSAIARQTTEIKKDLVSAIQPSDAVAAGYDFVPMVSNRTRLYSMHYAFEGKKQYSTQPYVLPPDTNVLLIDFNDFITYNLQSKENFIYKTSYPAGSDRINQLIDERGFGLQKIIDDQGLYAKNVASTIKLIEKNATVPEDARRIDVDDQTPLQIIGYEKNNQQPDVRATVPVSLYWHVNEKIADDYFFILTVKSTEGKTIYTKTYPLDYGLYPTSTWPGGETVKINYWFAVPSQYLEKKIRLIIQPETFEGYLDLDGVRSAKQTFSKITSSGSGIEIDYSTL